MITVVLSVVSGIGFIWLLVIVHENGHYLFGRVLGVPAEDMRVEITGNPPHVALRDGDRWVPPMDESYAEIFQRHCPSLRAAWLYIAGGVIGETVVALVMICVLVAIGIGGAAVILAWSTTLFFVAYVLGDLAISLSRRMATGDWSAMYTVHPGSTFGLLIGAGAAKAAPLLWFAF